MFRTPIVKRGGKAHAAIDCEHLSDTQMVGNSSWRVATDAQCRALGIAWCDISSTAVG